MSKNIVVGVTGASGAFYARRLIQELVAAGVHTHLIFSPYGRRLFAEELGISPITVEALVGEALAVKAQSRITLHAYNDVGSVLASGSFKTDGMVICPCSASTLGAVASGLGENLLHRAAQVTLKEMRRLVLLYREMPMSQIDLKNALTLSQAGAVICPACPGFYLLPRTIDDLVDFVVGKMLDLLNVPHRLNTRWEPIEAGLGEPTPEGRSEH